MPKSSKPPAFQFYAKDWISSKSVRMMNPTQRGYYIQLMAEAWDNTPIGHLPNEPELLRVLAGEQDLESWELNHLTVLDQFKVRGKLIYSPRLCAERKKQSAYQQNKRKAGTTSARVRKEKKLGFNRPSTDTPTEINSSSSSSSSSSSANQNTKSKPSRADAQAIPTDPRWADFIEDWQKAFGHVTGKKFKPSQADFAVFKKFLIDNREVDREVWRKCLNNWAKSLVSHTKPFRFWGMRILEYEQGPLDKFWEPLTVNGVKANGKPKAEQRIERNDDKYARIEQRIAGVPEGAGVGLPSGTGGSGNRDVDPRSKLLSNSGNPGRG